MKSAGNSEYKVIITRGAKMQLAQILRYLRQDLKSEQAARSVKEDMEEAMVRLSHVAGSLKLCDHPDLRALGYRTIHLRHHQYFMLYKIVGNVVRVGGIYHDLQDYENIVR